MTTRAITAAEAISHSYLNRDEIIGSETCGCYRCLAQFSTSEITLWADSVDPDDDDPGALRGNDDKFPGQTAVCPKCEDTSVIGDAAGVDITEEFLKTVHEYWCKK